MNDLNTKECNRALIVGPSGCGKTYSLLNQPKLVKHDMSIKVVTSSDQYKDHLNWYKILEILIILNIVLLYLMIYLLNSGIDPFYQTWKACGVECLVLRSIIFGYS